MAAPSAVCSTVSRRFYEARRGASRSLSTRRRSAARKGRSARGQDASRPGAPQPWRCSGESGSGSELTHCALLGLLASAARASVRFLAQPSNGSDRIRARPDVIHTNGMKAHLLAGPESHRRGLRLVIHLHDFIGARRASKRLLPALRRIRPAAVFIANSQAVARDFTAIAPGADVRTIYNVVDTDYFREGPAEPDW